MGRPRHLACEGQGWRHGARGQGAEDLTCVSLPLAALGTLEFTLLFDADNSALHCTVSRAQVRMGGA